MEKWQIDSANQHRLLGTIDKAEFCHYKENNLTHGWPNLFSQQSTKVWPGGKQTLLCNVKQSYTGLLC